ncbi:hypothetical protein FAM09_13130 [Niastella caeni]|uniref:Ppx/GppA phosphatase domain-containing protein n=1 Tax=Niastella caeni TaxID=2569763 RepID=A0A4S8I187_9BACT|nr:hypothetical protein [Niastella caeni]THU39442.1 hypothetical protein FAM09_13130 [Niastella caeni]
MSKIFRLHTGSSENIEHWQTITSALTETFINSIDDPAGSTAHTQITSIPSPFARMDLVRTAFQYVNSKKKLDGTTIYHRMVSDCLDVAEIFFNIDALHDKIEVLEWNSGITLNGGQLDVEANSDLGKLILSSNPKHKLLGETLKMFLFQDQKAFNFSDLKHCYLLNYKHGPELINIIGGTSPATLFFSSANDLSFVDISFANDRVFDNKYFPLYKRGRDFIKFFYSFRAAFPRFSEVFPDINTYLDLTVEMLDDAMKDTIRAMDETNYQSEYVEIVVHAEGNNAEILGTKLRTKNYGVIPSGDDNDFIIEASRIVEGLTPCVLPNEPFNEPLKYAGGTWQRNYHENVPYADDRPLQERTLPNQTHIKYPYLTVSDLLEPYLIRLPYPIDNGKFFNGHYEFKASEKDHGFALPVKKNFFEYFTIADLQGTVADGKKRFELQPLPAGVKAVLRIPIKNNRYIQFTRLYAYNQFHDKIQKANEKENQGIITENQFTLAIYPFIKLNPGINPHYRVLLVDRDVQPLTKHHHYSLNFFDESNPGKPLQLQLPRLRSSKDQAQGVTTKYHIIENNFSLIEISNNNSTGLLIPLFKAQPVAAKSFKFAIDFGTTNTHVEYKVINEDAKPFDITEKDVQVGTLHSPTEETEIYLKNPKLGFGADDIINIIKEEFCPFIINQSTQYKFPQRTIIGDNGSFNPNEANFALADFNIPFWYLKEDLRLSSEITPNLKWVDFSNDARLARRTKAFLKQLFLMIRNKVLLNGGDLAATEIVWFYPSSMPKFRRDFFQKSWEGYYHRYFPNAAKLNKMSESFAPFYYYYHKENVRPHDRPAVSIDIGGGTTDIVIYHSENPIALTSFTFAANAIFGDGYGNTSSYNGFVQRYEGKIKEALSGTSANQLINIYDNLKQKNSSSVELIEFFFSLEDNKLIKDNKIPLSFSNMLAEDNDLKLVFIFFYAAIVYHVARLMKAKHLPVPEYITFSGNGSKVVKLAGGGSDLSSLLDYTKIIFEDVYETKSPSIEFRFFKSPKEITCKGGLECTNFSRFERLEQDIKTVLIGSESPQLIPDVSLHYTQIENQEVINSVNKEVATFIDRFFSWNTKFNYYQNFGINPKGQQEYKDLLTSKIKVDLISGIKEKLKETHDNVDINIEETLFFYPVAGAINRLAYKIHNNLQVKTAMI